MKPFRPAFTRDPIAGIAECHVRIRTYCEGLQRLVALPSLNDPRVPSAAAQAFRYFSIGLPLHAEDEDVSFAPRLLRLAPELAAVFDRLSREHQSIESQLAGLLPRLSVLAKGNIDDPEALRANANALCGTLLPHIAFEETAFFPACSRLQSADLAEISIEMAERRST